MRIVFNDCGLLSFESRRLAEAQSGTVPLLLFLADWRPSSVIRLLLLPPF